MRTPHTGYWKRTKVLVTLRTGETFIDRFKDKKSGVMIFEEAGKVPINTIRNTSVYKEQPHQKQGVTP
jgi:hypothetical protein